MCEGSFSIKRLLYMTFAVLMLYLDYSSSYSVIKGLLEESGLPLSSSVLDTKIQKLVNDEYGTRKQLKESIIKHQNNIEQGNHNDRRGNEIYNEPERTQVGADIDRENVIDFSGYDVASYQQMQML